ncbi:hypothetical protein CBR_g10871 [Chara braunii]|uniref:RING-CH-type domain-containing protein n=1 Tax=Chara braunii TaxID=69332 RepID=A0A388KPF6_CHABU|nr:hypothetical protein CBR_g10871 [Chara braunii]|eukprot:GBG71934.1 hypothetical protein CBR_g10871 [Chara braunii]
MDGREESPVGVGMGTAAGGDEDAYVAVDVAEISSLDDVAVGHGPARNDHRLRRLARTASGSSFSGPKADMHHSKSFTTLSLLRQVGLQRGSSPSLHPSHSCDAGGSSLSEALTGGDSLPAGSDSGVFQRPSTTTEEASSSRWRYVRELSAVQGSATNALAVAKRLFNANSLSRHGSFHRLSGDVLVIRRVGDTPAGSHTPGNELMTDCDGKPLPGAPLHVHAQETAPMAAGGVGDEEEGGRPSMSLVTEEEASLSEAARSADGISPEKTEGKSGKLDGGNRQKLTDSEGKEVEEQEIPVEEAVCRICHSELNEGGEAFKLECSCRGDLALAHKDCAVKWFRLKGTSTCEVCKNDVKNLVVELQRRANPNDTMEDDVVTRQRARVEVSGLMLTSMPAYFCYFERLVSHASKDGNRPLLISLPLGCLVGIASTMVAQSAAPSHMWAYAGLQFLLIVACTVALEKRTDFNPSVVVMLGSLAGMGVAFFLRCVGKEVYFLTRGRPRARESREEASQTASDREVITEPVEVRPTSPPPAGRARWNGLARGSREILASMRQQRHEEGMRAAATVVPSNARSSRPGGQSEGQQLQPSYGPFPEGFTMCGICSLRALAFLHMLRIAPGTFIKDCDCDCNSNCDGGIAIAITIVIAVLQSQSQSQLRLCLQYCNRFCSDNCNSKCDCDCDCDCNCNCDGNDNCDCNSNCNCDGW